tara:strand:- start:7074 stop:7370 length:297 start_codon:yes stop_codon:yes gene_type:complete
VPTNIDKYGKFKELAENRVNRASKAIKSISSLRNRRSYHYTEADVDHIEAHLRKVLNESMKSLRLHIPRKEKFKLTVKDPNVITGKPVKVTLKKGVQA